MITLDMTQKSVPVIIPTSAFSTETGILTLQISLGAYVLTGKTVTAVFSKTAVETGVLTVTNGVIQLPIVAGYVQRGVNEIQLNIRLGLTLEQSPIMTWRILQPVNSADPSDSDVDVITWLLNAAVDATNAAQAVVDSFEEDMGEGHELQDNLQVSIATGTPLLSDLQDANGTAGGLLTDLTTPSTGAIDVATAIEATLTDTTIPAAQSIEQTLRVTTTPAATSINGTLASTTTPAAVAIEQTLRETTTPAAVAIEETLRVTTTPAAVAINDSLTDPVTGSIVQAEAAEGDLQTLTDYYRNRESIVDPISSAQYRWTLQISNGVPFLHFTNVAYDPTFVLDTTIVDITTGVEYKWAFAINDGEISLFLEEVI